MDGKSDSQQFARDHNLPLLRPLLRPLPLLHLHLHLPPHLVKAKITNRNLIDIILRVGGELLSKKE